MADYPIAALIACAERECKQRERVYPRLIASGRMSREKAREELRMMRAIVANLRAQDVPDLFPGVEK